MERRGRVFFDDTIRFGRIPDLVRPSRIQVEFEEKVVADTPEQIEARIDELVDWMVEQDLRQWMAVSEHLSRRKEEHEERIIGQSGPKEGTLAYDRQRLIDSIGLATNQAISGFDKEKEAAEMAESASSACRCRINNEPGSAAMCACRPHESLDTQETHQCITTKPATRQCRAATA